MIVQAGHGQTTRITVRAWQEVMLDYRYTMYRIQIVNHSNI